MKKFLSSKLALLAAALVTVAALSGLVYYSLEVYDKDDSENEQVETQQDANVYTIDVEIAASEDEPTNYQASVEKGQTAFQMLENLSANTNFEFTYDEYDFGVMITSMRGITPDESHFWKFQINGNDASVGVSDYEVQEGDEIKFVLDEIMF